MKFWVISQKLPFPGLGWGMFTHLRTSHKHIHHVHPNFTLQTWFFLHLHILILSQSYICVTRISCMHVPIPSNMYPAKLHPNAAWRILPLLRQTISSVPVVSWEFRSSDPLKPITLGKHIIGWKRHWSCQKCRPLSGFVARPVNSKDASKVYRNLQYNLHM